MESSSHTNELSRKLILYLIGCMKVEDPKHYVKVGTELWENLFSSFAAFTVYVIGLHTNIFCVSTMYCMHR